MSRWCCWGGRGAVCRQHEPCLVVVFIPVLLCMQIREHLKNEAVRGQSNQASTDMFQ
jgi:hypothetical protein